MIMSTAAVARAVAPSMIETRGPSHRTDAVPQQIALSSPDVSDQDRDRVLEVLQGRTLSLGPLLPAFEEAMATAAGTRFAVAVNSGTSALHLCVKGAGIGEGDEVITTPFSFVASANCMLYERAIPRFVDIEIDTYNIDPAAVSAHIRPTTRGILPVHVFGRPCDMDAINHIASRRGLTVIEDACEAIGAVAKGKRAGGLGDAGVFAFYPNKQITTGEGGAVLTNDEELAVLCRSWRNQGRGEGSTWLQHERLGYNYRLSDINCALGLGQLSRLESILEKRQRVADCYDEWLTMVPEVILPAAPAPGTSISWFVYVVRLQDEFCREQRDQILASLRSAGIGCSNYFSPIHLQSFYQETFGYRRGDFPITEFVSDRTIALPFHNNLSDEQVSIVTNALGSAIRSLKRPLVAVPAIV
jgi:perosamine synthetase